MYKFLKTYNLWGLDDEEIENVNRPVISEEIKSVIENFPTNKSPGLDEFIGQFYHSIPIPVSFSKTAKY